jgi:TolB-like protein
MQNLRSVASNERQHVSSHRTWLSRVAAVCTLLACAGPSRSVTQAPNTPTPADPLSTVAPNGRAQLAVDAAGKALPMAVRDAQDTRPRIFVFYFNNNTLFQNKEYEPFRKGMADMMITEMKQNPAIDVLERDQLQAILEEHGLIQNKRIDPATAVELGKLYGARYMITGAYFIGRSGKDVRLDVRIDDVQTGVVLLAEKVEGKADVLERLVPVVAEKLNRRIADVTHTPPTTTTKPPGDSGTAGRGTEGTLADMNLYGQLLDALDRKDFQSGSATLAKLQQTSSPKALVAQKKAAEVRLRGVRGGP